MRRRAGLLVCVECGALYHVKPSLAARGTSYCSRECMARHYSKRMRGDNNPNHRPQRALPKCLVCGTSITTYNYTRKYCGHACYSKTRIGRPHRKHSGPTRLGGVDLNHDNIVAWLRLSGVGVIDCRRVGGGMPDLVTIGPKGVVLLEIKNGSTRYGRSGLSKRQRAWADKWPGPSPSVVYDVQSALRAVGL